MSKSCFICAVPESGVARKGYAMHPSWYDVDTEMAARTVYICDDCYVRDTAAGRRREAAWENNSLFHLSFEEIDEEPWSGYYWGSSDYPLVPHAYDYDRFESPSGA